MPIHDWTRVEAGTFHDFHQGWTREICQKLNRGVLPPDHFAMAEPWGSSPEPDHIAWEIGKATSFPSSGDLFAADTPPRAQQTARASLAGAAYARKADRIAIRHAHGRVVAIIELVSPGNKDSRHAIRAFTDKLVEFLAAGINIVVVDLFPPTPRDPDGIHQLVWDEYTGEEFAARPANKPLTVAGYDAGDPVTAYVYTVAVGDPLPDVPLFLAPGWYVNIPLEQTYATSWDVTPAPIRELVEPPAA